MASFIWHILSIFVIYSFSIVIISYGQGNSGLQNDVMYNISSSFGIYRGICVAKCRSKTNSNAEDCWYKDCPQTPEEYEELCNTTGCTTSTTCDQAIIDEKDTTEVVMDYGQNFTIQWENISNAPVTFYQFAGLIPRVTFRSEISTVLSLSDNRILKKLSLLHFTECGLAWEETGTDLCEKVYRLLLLRTYSMTDEDQLVVFFSGNEVLVDGFSVDVRSFDHSTSSYTEPITFTTTDNRMQTNISDLCTQGCSLSLLFQSHHCEFQYHHLPSPVPKSGINPGLPYCIISNESVLFSIEEERLQISWERSCRHYDKSEIVFLNWGYFKSVENYNNFFENRRTVRLHRNATSYRFDNLKPGIKYGFQIFYVYNSTCIPRIEQNYHTMMYYLHTMDETKSSILPKILGIGGGISILVYFVVFICCIYHRSTSTKNKVQRSEQSVQNVYDDHPSRNTSRKSSATSDHLTLSDFHKSVMLADYWEFDPMRLRLGTSLGKGAFGQVVEGFLEGRICVRQSSKSGWEWVPQDTGKKDVLRVAVKLLKDFASDAQKQEFLQEIQMMKHLGYHPNVVCLIGCCTVMEPVCLVVEACPQGDLKKYLLNSRSKILARIKEENLEVDDLLTSADLLSFARQITMGMEYLSQKGYVHRDLAARNVLVSDNKSLKIADFGLTRYIYEERQYVGKKGARIPVKWMSIEAIIDGVYTTESDVWSFGVILYEIITLGGEPYPGIVNRDLPKMLCNGFRMERPEQCPDDLYTMMLDCWHETPKQRPNFTKLRLQLEGMLEQNTPYLSLYPSQAHIFHCLDDIREESDEGESVSEGEPMLEDTNEVDRQQSLSSSLTLSRSRLKFDVPDEKDGTDSVIEGDVDDDSRSRKRLNGSVEYVNTGRQISTDSTHKDDLILSLLSSPDSCDSGVAVDNRFLYDSKGQPIEYDGIEQMV